jgi:competence protein ComEA
MKFPQISPKYVPVLAATFAALIGLGLATEVSAQPRAARAAAAQTATNPASDEGVVNVNAATADELMRLPGIGPAKAAAILALRARLSGQRFARVEDLLRVRGIGRATLRKLRPLMALTGATTYVERTRSGARRASGEGEPDGGDAGDDAGE